MRLESLIDVDIDVTKEPFIRQLKATNFKILNQNPKFGLFPIINTYYWCYFIS